MFAPSLPHISCLTETTIQRSVLERHQLLRIATFVWKHHRRHILARIPGSERAECGSTLERLPI